MNEKIAVGVLLFLLRQAGVSESDIPKMLAIAQMESGLTNNIEGKVNDNGTRDVGIWQINAEEYWHDSEGTNDNSKGPDTFTRKWMESNGGELSMEEFREKVKTDIVYATQFAVDVVEYRGKNPKSFPGGKFSAWSVWKSFIQPYVDKGVTDITGIAPGRQPDMDLAVEYIEEFDSIEEIEYEEGPPPVSTTSTTIPTPRELGELDRPNSYFPTREDYMEGRDFDSWNKSMNQLQQLMVSQVNRQREEVKKPPLDFPGVPQSPEFGKVAQQIFEILSGIRHFDKSENDE